MLNATPHAPKIMNASFNPMLGTVSEIRDIWSSLVNVRIPVSQNDGPVKYLIEWLVMSKRKN